MNTNRLLLLGAVALSAGLAACHDDHNSSPPPTPPPSSSMSADTAQVLALAQVTSETSTPFPVNGGAFTINDTSETSFPI